MSWLGHGARTGPHTTGASFGHFPQGMVHSSDTLSKPVITNQPTITSLGGHKYLIAASKTIVLMKRKVNQMSSTDRPAAEKYLRLYSLG